ncbi:hypothetical protein CNR22_19130 [Sphingobacteriaceae bacterium]|nr:hypothetical protein CNR22_19130 [Sphingobacteriaceae bacterium]
MVVRCKLKTNSMKKEFLIISTIFLFSCNNVDNSTVPTITKPVENITATKDQQERRKKSEDYCKSHNVPVYNTPNSLFVDPENEVTIRTQDEVVDRAFALCYLGLKSEGLEQVHLDKMDKDFGISTKLSPNEIAYATAKQPTEQQKIDANWRYESLHVMLWALGFVDSLNYPDQVCNVTDDVKIIHDLTPDEFRKKAKLRSKKEILDQADLILRLNWACVSAQVKNEQAPSKLDRSVVVERHYSFNWLIKYMNQDWDNVSTDT